jgi:hypothetical protein
MRGNERSKRKEERGYRLAASLLLSGAGVDSAWEQKKPEARKMLLEAADSRKSATRFVGLFLD